MQRIKSIDTFRGLCILAMVVWHIALWWTESLDSWVLVVLKLYLYVICAAGFLFVSGLSTALSLRMRMEKVNSDPNYSKNDLLKEYYYRSLLFLGLGVLYNAITVSWLWGVLAIWSWFILFTVGICMLITYPIVKLSKTARLILIIFLILITYPIYDFFGALRLINFYGELPYHFLFNPSWEYPFLPFSSIFFLGTIVGDIFYEVYSIKEEDIRRNEIKKKIVVKLTLIGALIVVGTLLSNIFIFHDDLSLLDRMSFTMMTWGIGWCLVIIGVFTYLHEFVFSPEWTHPFLFYFSTYSLTIYFGHNIVAILFWNMFDIYSFWLPTFITVLCIWKILKITYNKYGVKPSIKYCISKVTKYLSTRKS